MSKINVESIRKGDRVKVMLFGLPESDWLPVRQAVCGQREVVFPDGTPWWCDHHEITAHEPAAPALPEWWGSRVILREGPHLIYDLIYDPILDLYRNSAGNPFGADEFEPDEQVTVIVDRDGNQPALDGVWSAAAAEALKAELYEAERMRDEWEGMYKITLATSLDLRSVGERRERDGADLEAFRAKVREVRDDLAIALPVHDNWVARGTLDHLSAILDGTDQ